MVVGHDVVRVGAHPLAPRDVRVDRAAEDRPRADDRDLDRQVVQRLRAGAVERLHLRPALDLEDAHRVGGLDRRVGLRVVERDPREVHPLAARLRDRLHAALDRREHPEPQQVDLQEARVGAGVLVPLAQLAALHRRRQHGAAVDQRAGGDDHPARVLREVAREPVRLVAQPRQPLPAPRQRGVALLGRVLVVGVLGTYRHRLPLGGGHGERRGHPRVRVVDGRRRTARLQPQRALHVARDALHRPRLGPAGGALQLARRQPEHLPELPDRAARAEGRERRHQRRALAPVALVHARDQLLAHVAREVQVDVRQRRQLLVEEAAQEQVVGHRVDVREAGEVTDDRGHRGPAAAARRQQRPRRVRPAHLDRHLARELQQVAVQDEEARQAQRVDHPQLLVQARVRIGMVDRAGRIALVHPRPAQLAELAQGVGVLRSRIAVAEVRAQVEPQPVRQRDRLGHRVRVVLEPGGHGRR